MKTLRERFEDNYVAVHVPADNKDGFKVKYVYYKPWHIWNLPEEQLRRKKALIGAATAASIALFFFASVQDTQVNKEFWVGIPSIFALCAIIFEALGVVQFIVARYRTTESHFNDVTMKLKFATLVHALCLLAAALGCAGYMAAGAVSAGSFAVALCYLASAGLSMLVRAQYGAIPLKTVENTTLEEHAD